ncbi:hypothetical protein D6D05_00816 [Aureobasidium pullulans]|nr:hypothetical protein D6D05_00816 [Aureobasidium pullulans]
MFSSFRDKFRVLDANIHNMDEHGLCIGKINPRKVCRNSQTREWVSIVECISGGGTSVSPLIIFEGLNVNIDWTPDEPPPYKYKATPTAWTNDEVALAWLNEIFIPETRPRGAQPSNFESAFKKAGLIPFDPQSVIDRPAVVKNPRLLPPSELDDLQPRIYDPKTLEKDLYELNKENNASIDEKLDMATLWELKYKTLEFKHIALQEKKGRKKAPPKRGRELVDAEDIVAKQKEWKRDNETPPPSRSVRSRMKKIDQFESLVVECDRGEPRRRVEVDVRLPSAFDFFRLACMMDFFDHRQICTPLLQILKTLVGQVDRLVLDQWDSDLLANVLEPRGIEVGVDVVVDMVMWRNSAYASDTFHSLARQLPPYSDQETIDKYRVLEKGPNAQDHLYFRMMQFLGQGGQDSRL